MQAMQGLPSQDVQRRDAIHQDPADEEMLLPAQPELLVRERDPAEKSSGDYDRGNNEEQSVANPPQTGLLNKSLALRPLRPITISLPSARETTRHHRPPVVMTGRSSPRQS